MSGGLPPQQFTKIRIDTPKVIVIFAAISTQQYYVDPVPFRYINRVETAQGRQ